MVDKIYIKDICDRLGKDVPGILELAINERLPLWVECSGVLVYERKRPGGFYHKQINVRPAPKVLSALQQAIGRKLFTQNYVDESCWWSQNSFRRIDRGISENSSMEVERESGPGTSSTTGTWMSFAALPAFDIIGEGVNVFARGAEFRLKLYLSDLFANSADVETFGKEQGAGQGSLVARAIIPEGEVPITQVEAAAAAGVTVRTIHNWLKSGRLPYLREDVAGKPIIYLSQLKIACELKKRNRPKLHDK